MGYGNIIKKIRKNKNMNVRDFSKLVDVAYSHVSRLEREFSTKGKEKLSPPIDLLQRICDRTHYPFRQFLEEAGYIEESRIQTLYNKMTDSQKDELMQFAHALLGINENTDVKAI